MPNPRVERLTGTFSPTGAATFNLAAWAVFVLTGVTPVGRRLIGFSCRVRRLGDGTGTVSFGSTTGGVASIMSTAQVAADSGGILGRKTSASGSADLSGNGVSRAPTAATEFITGTYVQGTNGVHPVVNWCALVINEDVFDDLLVA